MSGLIFDQEFPLLFESLKAISSLFTFKNSHLLVELLWQGDDRIRYLPFRICTIRVLFTFLQPEQLETRNLFSFLAFVITWKARSKLLLLLLLFCCWHMFRLFLLFLSLLGCCCRFVSCGWYFNLLLLLLLFMFLLLFK